MKYYYKDSDSQRYKHIREAKLSECNRNSRSKYFGYLLFTCFLFYFTVPLLQILHYDENNITNKFYLLLAVYISFIYTAIVSNLIMRFFVHRFKENDIDLKVDILRPLVAKITISSISIISIPFLLWFIILMFNPNYWPCIKANDQSSDKIDVSKYFVIFLYLYNLSLLLFLNVFVYLPERLVGRIKNKQNKIYKYIYWVYFLKSTILNYPQFIVGLIIFVFLTILPGFLQSEWGKYNDNALSLISSYFSFWFVAFTMAALPIMQSLIEYGESYYKYSIHIIRDIVIPNLENHTIIVGTGNLGSLLIKSCFFDIHPEGYGIKTICFPDNKNNFKSEEHLKDYSLVIDHNLDIYLVSRRLLIIDKNASHFKYIFGNNSKFPIGLVPPGSYEPKNEGIMIIGICGDAKDSYVLNGARINKSKIVINANPDPVLSLDLAKLAKKGQPQKQVLSITNTPSFDVLNSFTYDNQIYLIDTKHIEGISLSQRIILWVIKYLKNNTFQKKIININEKPKRYDFIVKKIPKIIIIGNGRAISQTIQSLIYSLFQIYKSPLLKESVKGLIKTIVKEKLFLMTTDKYIISETHKENPQNCAHNFVPIFQNDYWKFYPIKHSKLVLSKSDNFEKNDLYEIPVYILDPNNLENYLKVLENEEPDLIVLNSEYKYESIAMFNRASNAAKIIDNNLMTKDNISREYKPHIIVYSHKDDKHFISDQMKKHFTLNLKRDEIVGFPSQPDKESKVTRDYVTANQFSAMIRSLLHPDKEGELTFNVSESPGALANILTKLCNMKIEFIDNSSFVPSFIFCYSFVDRRYKDTFIFTGTAELLPYVINADNNHKHCFINCNDEDREDIYRVVKKNLDGKPIFSNDDLLEPGTLRDCPISSIIRHKEKHFDTIFREKTSRYFRFQLKNPPLKSDMKYNSKIFIDKIPDISHFKIWSEGLYPGALAESLTLAILGSVSKERYFYDDIDFIPDINFGTSYPYPEEESNSLGQESLYIRLWDETKFRMNHYTELTSDDSNRCVQARFHCFLKGVIRSIMVKCGGEFELTSSGLVVEKNISNGNNKNSGWLEYSIKLAKHLNKEYPYLMDKFNYSESYSLFLIEKNYVEGIWLDKFNSLICRNEETELLEINNYYKVNTDNSFAVIDYQIIKKIINDNSNKQNTHSTDRYNYTQDFRFDNDIYDFPGTNKFDFKSQLYKLVLIRQDLIENAKQNCSDEYEKDTHINKLFFIDDL